MTKAHKDALARGRDEGRAVRRYLEAIERNRPRRGRKRTPESVRKRLSDVDERLESADPLARLHLLQERADLQAELARASSSTRPRVVGEGLRQGGQGLRATQGHRATTPGAPRESAPRCSSAPTSPARAATAPRPARRGAPGRRATRGRRGRPPRPGPPPRRSDQAGSWACRVAALTRDPSRPRPSVPPVMASLARSGWGMRPTTLPSSLHTPAMSSTEPLGLAV